MLATDVVGLAATKPLVVIVHYRTPSLLIQCLRSLASDMALLPSARVVVVDNDSNDGSVERIAEAVRAGGWSAWVTLRPLAENAGSAHGNNVAIRPAWSGPAATDYFYLLNPDTRIGPGAVVRLLEFMEAHAGVGIAGSQLEDPDGTAQTYAFRLLAIW